MRKKPDLAGALAAWLREKPELAGRLAAAASKDPAIPKGLVFLLEGVAMPSPSRSPRPGRPNRDALLMAMTAIVRARVGAIREAIETGDCESLGKLFPASRIPSIMESVERAREMYEAIREEAFERGRERATKAEPPKVRAARIYLKAFGEPHPVRDAERLVRIIERGRDRAEEERKARLFAERLLSPRDLDSSLVTLTKPAR
jgi:microcompartment protein CcmL/EutN